MARSFRDHAELLLACLRAAGRTHDAQLLEAEALRLDPSNKMKAALANASTLTSDCLELFGPGPQGADD